VSIFSGVNGYLDKIEVSAIGRFEETLIAEMHSRHKDVLDTISNEGKVSDETQSKLKDILENLVKNFV